MSERDDAGGGDTHRKMFFCEKIFCSYTCRKQNSYWCQFHTKNKKIL